MISVSAMTRSEQFGEGSFPVIVKSLGQRGSTPRQIRLKVGLSQLPDSGRTSKLFIWGRGEGRFYNSSANL